MIKKRHTERQTARRSILRPGIRTFIELTRANRPSTRHTWSLALITAAEATICVLILVYGYRRAGERTMVWAVVSAVLVLQPGFKESLSASATRLVANILGALTGFAVGSVIKQPTLSVIVALIIVILLCELWRLDLGVRSACASVIIVLMAGEGPIWGTSYHRVLAVMIGCSLALLVQFIISRISRRVHAIKSMFVKSTSHGNAEG